MQALLHGHSYTAHPLGCSAALEALDIFQDPALNPNLCLPPQHKTTSNPASGAALAASGEGVPGGNPAAAQQEQQHAVEGRQHSGGSSHSSSSNHSSSSMDGSRGAAELAGREGDCCEAGGCGGLLPLWSEERVGGLSRLPGGQGVVALGEPGPAVIYDKLWARCYL